MLANTFVAEGVSPTTQLPEPLGRCLDELRTLCEKTHAELISLQGENQTLKRRVQTEEVSDWDMPGQPTQGNVLGESALKLTDDPVVTDNLAGDRRLAPATIEIPDTPNSGGKVSFNNTPKPLNTPSSRNRQLLKPGSKSVTNSQLFAGDKSTSMLSACRLGMLVTNAADDVIDENTEHYDFTLTAFLSHLEEEVCNDETSGTDKSIKAFSMIHKVVHSFTFKAFCMVIIVANTLYIGVQADQEVKNTFRRAAGEHIEEVSHVPEAVFVIWFTLELLIRIAADRVHYFQGEDWRWNWFDVVLVVYSLFSLFAPNALEGVNFSFLRMFRVFRLVRVVRVVKTVKPLKSLRTMVYSLLNTFVSLLWTFCMIGIVVFVFGVIFAAPIQNTYDVASDVADLQSLAEDAEMFGSLFSIMVSLFSAITGGNDWMVYGEAIQRWQHGDVYFIVFLFYIAFSMIGVLNVVTGIFVDNAVMTRTEDEIVENFEDDQKRTLHELKHIFKAADVDKSGTVSCKELARHLKNPRVKASFAGLGIDPSDAVIIFALMDKDGSDAIEIETFINGALRLKGEAKSLDVLSLMFDNVRQMVQFRKLCTFVERETRVLREAIAPGSTKSCPWYFDEFSEGLHSSLADTIGSEDFVFCSEGTRF
eukprot:TRINITY_DN29409_c0_g1_i2.p1 TRINITY_DN29409_c0_g1~~TRINITY_DN29409_c0_g1_i2.p1  ORF type:complete len:646 (+),score=111.15 TRINITY_DN29409_c0_g1_i2:201-2138(+)